MEHGAQMNQHLENHWDENLHNACEYSSLLSTIRKPNGVWVVYHVLHGIFIIVVQQWHFHLESEKIWRQINLHSLINQNETMYDW